MPLRRYVDRYPLVSLILFWAVVPLCILTIAVVGQVQNHRQTQRAQRTAIETKKLADQVDRRVNMILCNLTRGAWLERGRIMDGLVIATIEFVTRNPQLGDSRFLREFQRYHHELQREIAQTKPCPQG